MERLLCVKIASRGDLLLAAPAFRALREKRADAFITLLVGASCENMTQCLPYFDQIKLMDDRALMAGNIFQKFFASLEMLKQLQNSYAQIFIFHRDWRYAFLSWLAGIPMRKGFASRCGTKFLTHPYQAPKDEHHANQYLKMVFSENYEEKTYAGLSLEGVWKFPSAEKEKCLAEAARFGFKPEAGRWIGLGFGGGRNVKTRTGLKTWPIKHYQELADRLIELGYQIAWLGDDEDALMLEGKIPGTILAGKIRIKESAAVLGACHAVVANDSLLMHLSEAMGTPTIGLFGPTYPAHYRPLGKRSSHLWYGEKLECSPCHQDGYFPECQFEHRCMRDLSVESVLKKLGEIQ